MLPSPPPLELSPGHDTRGAPRTTLVIVESTKAGDQRPDALMLEAYFTFSPTTPIELLPCLWNSLHTYATPSMPMQLPPMPMQFPPCRRHARNVPYDSPCQKIDEDRQPPSRRPDVRVIRCPHPYYDQGTPPPRRATGGRPVRPLSQNRRRPATSVPIP